MTELITAIVPTVFIYNQHFVAMMNIINAARRNNINGKFEKHHIIPRCYFKLKGLPVDGSEANLVNLTYEEHAKVHALAALCAVDELKPKLKYASIMMNNRHDCFGESNPFFGQHHTVETRKKLSSMKMGSKVSDETKRKISKAHKGKPKPDEWKAKIKESANKIKERPWLHRPKSKEWKAKMSKLWKERRNRC